MLACLTKPTSGDVLLLGHSVIHHRQQVRHVISLSPQETVIAASLTVRENLEFMGGVHGFNKEEIKKNR